MKLMKLKRVSTRVLCIIVISIGFITARLVFSLLSGGQKSYDLSKMDLLQRAPFSFQKAIVNNINNSYVYPKPEVINPLREISYEYFTGVTRYKATVKLKAILKIPDEDKITPAQRAIIDNLVVELESAASRQEKNKILKAIKEIAGPKFGASISLSRVTSSVNNIINE